MDDRGGLNPGSGRGWAEAIPDPALVVLVGPAGSGKSTFAAARFRPEEIVSSDRLRAVVGSGEHDLDASADAFDLLDRIVLARSSRRLMTVVDTLGLDDRRRAGQLDLARRYGLAAIAVVFDVPERVARDRNRQRQRPVPAAVMTSQIRRFRQILPRLAAEGWSVIAAGDEEVSVRPAHLGPTPAPAPAGPGPDLYLQLSRFVGRAPLAGWLRDVALAAESAGFTGLAVMDHLVQIPQVGRPWEDLPEAYTTLAYLAAATTRLRLGALVTNINFRNPALLGKMLATLDVLAAGRAFCGLGLGWYRAEHEAYGLPFRPAPDRLHSLAETVGILRAMWAPGVASFEGGAHRVVNAMCYPRPLGHIDVLIGGRGRRVLDLAGRLGDGVNLVGTHGMEERIGWVRAAAAAAGRDPGTVAVSVLDTPLLGRDRAEVAALVEAHRARMPAADFAARHHAGTAADQAERLGRLAARGAGAVFVAPVGLSRPEQVLDWGPVVAALRA